MFANLSFVGNDDTYRLSLARSVTRQPCSTGTAVLMFLCDHWHQGSNLSERDNQYYQEGPNLLWASQRTWCGSRASLCSSTRQLLPFIAQKYYWAFTCFTIQAPMLFIYTLVDISSNPRVGARTALTACMKSWPTIPFPYKPLNVAFGTKITLDRYLKDTVGLNTYKWNILIGVQTFSPRKRQLQWMPPSQRRFLYCPGGTISATVAVLVYIVGLGTTAPVQSPSTYQEMIGEW